MVESVSLLCNSRFLFFYFLLLFLSLFLSIFNIPGITTTNVLAYVNSFLVTTSNLPHVKLFCFLFRSILLTFQGIGLVRIERTWVLDADVNLDTSSCVFLPTYLLGDYSERKSRKG